MSFNGVVLIWPTVNITVNKSDLWRVNYHFSYATIKKLKPANTQRNKNEIITSKGRFDIIITRLLRCVFTGNLQHDLHLCIPKRNFLILDIF